MGESLFNLIGPFSMLLSSLDPEYLKAGNEDKVKESFGLIADPSARLNQESVVKAVRTSGEVFNLIIVITKVNNNIITATLKDEDATTTESILPPRTASTSSMSYQDSLSSLQSMNLYGGLVVDLNEMNADANEWVGMSRYTAGMEEFSEVRAPCVSHAIVEGGGCERRVADRVLGPASLAGERCDSAGRGGELAVRGGEPAAGRGRDEGPDDARGARARAPAVRHARELAAAGVGVRVSVER